MTRNDPTKIHPTGGFLFSGTHPQVHSMSHSLHIAPDLTVEVIPATWISQGAGEGGAQDSAPQGPLQVASYAGCGFPGAIVAKGPKKGGPKTRNKSLPLESAGFLEVPEVNLKGLSRFVSASDSFFLATADRFRADARRVRAGSEPAKKFGRMRLACWAISK